MKSLKLCTLLYLIPMSAMAAQECSQNMTKSAPNARYEFNNNGTIKNRITGLTWMRCPLGKTWDSTEDTCLGDGQDMFWQAALNDVQSINQNPSHALHNFAGIKNWRMPNIKELVTLSEHSCFAPALNKKAFSNAFPYSTNQENYGAGDIRSYVWSNTSLLETQEVFTFDVRNAEIIAYAPTAIAGSVLLVAED